ncbi:MAG TPA: mandelate racemase/muconate lactonizing enzyme family protein [Solirubrobacterales bacterium]|nr:mandelate racemase/muconate lactonizing enzyme family protein [Solirubrobacterales bacterium]
MPSPIARVDLYSYELSYVGGSYVMSGDRVITALSSTVARVATSDGLVGFGETCPLGPSYLPAHAGGARAGLEAVAPELLGQDAADPVGVGVAMDAALLGHGYAKSAIDIACWDIFGKATGRPVCDLIGGRRQRSFPLYVAISLDSPEQMRSDIERHRAAGIRRFQLKLGGDPVLDGERARAAVAATEDGETVLGDANGGWTLRQALVAAAATADLPRFWLEQPCATMEDSLRLAELARVPLILDEVIVDAPSLLRAWNAGCLVGVNLKLGRVGGLTKARRLRDLGEALGLGVSVEDSWGGDLTTAAVSHLAASTGPALEMVSFMNDWTCEHLAGYQPRSAGGTGAAPSAPGLGIAVDEELLGAPFASFG